MLFADRPSYDLKQGFGTTKLTSMAEMLQVKSLNKNKLVAHSGKSANHEGPIQTIDFLQAIYKEFSPKADARHLPQGQFLKKA